MSKTGPGNSFRQGISLTELMEMFPDEDTARKWFEGILWPDGPVCPHCGCENVQTNCAHHSMPYRCRDKDCRKRFSVKTGTVMQASNLGCQVWAVAIYQLTTSLKSVSSMKLHRDLTITQKSAWHLAHRLRKTFEASEASPLSGPVEVDETYMGGKRKNMPKAKRKELTGRGPVGKTPVVGMKDRKTNEVRAEVIEHTDSATLIPFVEGNAGEGATVYTDEATAYQSLPTEDNKYTHESVKHSIEEYVRGDAHTNGIESFWSMLKRAHKGTFHKLSPKHLDRYVKEFAGRHNMRELDTIPQMLGVAKGMEGSRLRYKDLIADNGLPSQARAQ